MLTNTTVRQLMMLSILAFSLPCFSALVATANAEEHGAKPADDHKKEEKKPDDQPAGKAVSIGQYYDVPRIQVNLLTNDRKSVYLSIDIVIEMANEADRTKIDHIAPILIDAFKTYLSQVSPKNLNGSAGLYRMKAELLVRAVTLANPVVVNDILIKEMIVK